jgi:hypothetical protein
LVGAKKLMNHTLIVRLVDRGQAIRSDVEQLPCATGTSKYLQVAVIGKGRWGLVICSVLEHLLPQNIPIWLFSRHLAADRVRARVRRVFDADELPTPNSAGAAVVATAPHDHAETAARLLSRGWHVLVEKPLALDLRSARALVERAEELERHVWVGLVYLFAPYLSVLKPYADGKKNWYLEWYEPVEEIRWGERGSIPPGSPFMELVLPV